MKATSPALQIVHEVEKAPKELEELREISLAGIGRELRRLKHLRAEARRMNENAFREALAHAEAKAPALIEHNAMMSTEDIGYHRDLIENESRVVRSEVFVTIDERILLCHAEIGRRNAIRSRASARL